MLNRRIAPALALVCLTAVLAACGVGSDIPDQPPNETTADQGTQPPSGEPTDATGEATAEEDASTAVELAECDGILFESDAEISGEALAACMSAAMFAAGSGSHIVEDSEGRTHVDFEWTPEFSMYATGATTFVVKGDVGWIQMDGRWVRGDQSSSDPEEVMAGAVVELVRAFGDPRVMTSAFAQTTWTVVEEASVPTTGAVSDTAWLLEPQGTFAMLGVTVSDAQLWLRPDYLGVYYQATASMGGITATSSNTFTQWGEAVEIPDLDV